MKRMLLAVPLFVLIAGCSVGPRGDTTPLALSPRGARIQLTTAGGEVHGELLAMRTDGVLLITDAGAVTLVEFDAIQRGRAETGPRFTGVSARAGQHFDQLRRRSRFPQGLQPNVETELLRVHNQSSLAVVRP